MDNNIKQRHYKASPEIIRRNSRDFTRKALVEKAIGKSFLFRDKQKSLANPSLISSSHGQLEEVLLTIPQYAIAGEQNPYWVAYIDLIKKLPTYTKFIVITHESTKDTLQDWIRSEKLDEKRFRISTLPDYLHFSVWAEDGYVVSKNSKVTFFVEPFSFPRYADSMIADTVNNFTEYELTEAPLYFQGGNVLIGDDFFLIGADYPNNSLSYINSVIVAIPPETPQNLVRRLYNEYLDKERRLFYVGSKKSVPSEIKRKVIINNEQWTEIIYTGNHEGTVQPLFHIDMFITLAGRGEDGKYIILVGDPKMAYEILGQPIPKIAMVEVFDNIAKQFTDIGFKVIRNPIPLAYADDIESRERIWYFATSNNALVEIFENIKRVYLPTYGHGNWGELTSTDLKNKEIWEDLGFEVIQLGDFHPFAENLGAVHCIKKYLKRNSNTAI